MINKVNITKIVKKVSKRDQGVPDRELMHPRREWSIGLIIFLILVFTGGSYALFAFNSYSGISVEGEVVEVDQLHYKRADILKAIELYQQKRDDFESINLNQPSVVATEITPDPNGSISVDAADTEVSNQTPVSDNPALEPVSEESIVLE